MVEAEAVDCATRVPLSPEPPAPASPSRQGGQQGEEQRGSIPKGKLWNFWKTLVSLWSSRAPWGREG